MIVVRVKLSAWFMIGCLLAPTMGQGAVATAHTLFDFSGERPEQGWRVNLWGKNADGSKGRADIAEGYRHPADLGHDNARASWGQDP